MGKEFREKNTSTSKPAINGFGRGALDGDVIKLYEDLSNFLVLNVNRGDILFPHLPNLQERTFHCTYTYVVTEQNLTNPSNALCLANLPLLF